MKHGETAIRSTDELFNGTQGAGASAAFLANGLNMSSLRLNGVLRKEEWKIFDDAVIKEATTRLTGVADLISAGLTFNLPNALGTTILEYETESDMDPATRSMEGVTPAQRDRVDYALVTIPIHITHKDFRISLRVLEASRKLGSPLDTTQAALATRIVAESLEDALFNGAGVVVGTAQAYGYTTHTNRNTGTISNAWDGTATGEQVLADVIAMISAMQGDRMYGPYVLYVNSTYWPTGMLEDFKAASDKSVFTRLMELPDISAIKVSDDLSSTEVVLVQLTSDVVDIINGEEVQTVQWDTDGGFMINFKVMGIQVPRVKATKAGRSGIVHYSE